MGRPKKIDAEAKREEIVKIVYEESGVLGSIALRLGVSRQTMATVRDENEWLKEAFLDAVEQALDSAEKTVLDAIKTTPKDAQWYLERKGKDRGYGRELKVDANMTQKAVFHIYLPDNGRESENG